MITKNHPIFYYIYSLKFPCRVIIANLTGNLMKKLYKAGIREQDNLLRFCPDASCVYKLTDKIRGMEQRS